MPRAPEIAVTDTHALIWWMTDQPRRLGRGARAFFSRVDEGTAVVCVPVVALVELDEAMHAGDLSLDESFPAFVQRLASTPSRYQLIDLTPEIVARAHELFTIPERGDRLIAATAAVLDYPLVTRDPEVASAFEGDRIWD